MELPKQSASKVNLNEVEEKLRAMRLKRLSRISSAERDQPFTAVAEESQCHNLPTKKYISRLNNKGKPAPIPPKPPLKPIPSSPSQKPPLQSTGAIPKIFKKTPAPPRPLAETPARLPTKSLMNPPPADLVFTKPPVMLATSFVPTKTTAALPTNPDFPKPPAMLHTIPDSAKPAGVQGGKTVPEKTREEKILRKLQRNWVALDEILASNSAVDSDEMEDLTSSLIEGEELVERYKCRLKALEARRSSGGSIGYVLQEIRKEIEQFKGLKRDDGYRIIRGKLTDCLTVCKTCYENRVSEVRAYEKLLEVKVTKHELMLLKILHEQVDDIYNQHKTK